MFFEKTVNIRTIELYQISNIVLDYTFYSVYGYCTQNITLELHKAVKSENTYSSIALQDTTLIGKYLNQE